MAKQAGTLLLVWLLSSPVLFWEQRITNAQASSLPANVCPLLGSNVTTQFTRSRRDKLFMNFGAPAQCNGTVTSWHYCSYNEYQEEDDECDDREDYTSIFLVYRQTGPSTYQRVSGSSREVTISLRCPSDGGFRCGRSQTLSSSEQFDIQENDIVAACLPDHFFTNPIELVGEESSSPSRQVYRYDGSFYEFCSSSQLATIDTQNSAFTLDSGVYRLHLYAEIETNITTGPVAQCSGGSNPPPFTPLTNSGTYLNTDSPISCSDTITSWHYCYYPSQASDSQLNYTATVGMWRLNSVTNQYDLLQGSDYTLRLVQPASTPAVIFCRMELLQYKDYVRVETGDVIGVSLPQQNPLPIVASGATGYSLKTHSASNTPTAIQQSILTDASSMALHLYPTIESTPLPTTKPPPTTDPDTTTEPQSTTEALTTTEAPTTTTTTTMISTTEAQTTLPPTTADTTSSLKSSTTTVHASNSSLTVVAAAVGSATGGVVLLTIVTASLVIIISVAVCYVKMRRRTFSMNTNAAYRRRHAAQNIQVSQDNGPRYTAATLSPLQAAATTEDGGNSEIYENLSTENTAHDDLAVELATNVAYSPHSFGDQEDEYDYIDTYEPII